MKSYLLIAVLLVVAGCAPKQSAPPKVVATAPPAVEAPPSPIAEQPPVHLTWQQALTALKRAGFMWEKEDAVPKDLCRTDEGCVSGTRISTRGLDYHLVITEWDLSVPMARNLVTAFAKDEKKNASSNGSVVVAHNIVLFWSKRVSYEDETKARSAILALAP